MNDDNDDDMKSGDKIQDVIRERAARLRQNQLNSIPKNNENIPLQENRLIDDHESAWSHEPVEPTSSQRFETFTQRYDDIWSSVIHNPTAPISFETCRELFPTITDIHHFIAAAGKGIYTDFQLQTIASYTMSILSSGSLCRVMDFCRNPGTQRRGRDEDEKGVDELTDNFKRTKINTSNPVKTTPTRSREYTEEQAIENWRNVKRKTSAFYH